MHGLGVGYKGLMYDFKFKVKSFFSSCQFELSSEVFCIQYLLLPLCSKSFLIYVDLRLCYVQDLIRNTILTVDVYFSLLILDVNLTYARSTRREKQIT